MSIDLGTAEQISRTSLFVSAASFLVSMASLGITAYNARRDRAAIRATATFYSYASPTAQAKVVVKIVNVGRRPLGLHALIGLTSTSDWAGWGLASGALVLPEGQFHEIVLVQARFAKGARHRAMAVH